MISWVIILSRTRKWTKATDGNCWLADDISTIFMTSKVGVSRLMFPCQGNLENTLFFEVQSIQRKNMRPRCRNFCFWYAKSLNVDLDWKCTTILKSTRFSEAVLCHSSFSFSGMVPSDSIVPLFDVLITLTYMYLDFPTYSLFSKKTSNVHVDDL